MSRVLIAIFYRVYHVTDVLTDVRKYICIDLFIGKYVRICRVWSVYHLYKYVLTDVRKYIRMYQSVHREVRTYM